MKGKSCKCAMTAHWVMRIVLAVVFLSSAYLKLVVMGVGTFSEYMNLPVVVGWLVALGELAAGLGIIVGYFTGQKSEKCVITRLSGGVIALIMLGALVLTKLAGFEAGFPQAIIMGIPEQGVGPMYGDLALFALGLYFFMMGNCCGGGECKMCDKK